MITFQKESFIQCMAELPEIFHAHWREVAIDHNAVPLDPDWEQYTILELQGVLHMMTVRDNGVLIGYYLAFVKTHLHYKSTLHSWSDLLFLTKRYRNSGMGLASTGFRLIRETERMLKAMGVKKTYLMTKEYIPLNILTKRLAYRLTEMVYTKLL